MKICEYIYVLLRLKQEQVPKSPGPGCVLPPELSSPAFTLGSSVCKPPVGSMETMPQRSVCNFEAKKK